MQHWKFSGTRRGEHVHVEVRCGPSPEHRPLLGSLVMSVPEWREFVGVLRHCDDSMPVDGSLEIQQVEPNDAVIGQQNRSE